MLQHIFHSECIRNWLRTQRNCPICREYATMERVNWPRREPEQQPTQAIEQPPVQEPQQQPAQQPPEPRQASSQNENMNGHEQQSNGDDINHIN